MAYTITLWQVLHFVIHAIKKFLTISTIQGVRRPCTIPFGLFVLVNDQILRSTLDIHSLLRTLMAT